MKLNPLLLLENVYMNQPIMSISRPVSRQDLVNMMVERLNESPLRFHTPQLHMEHLAIEAPLCKTINETNNCQRR